MADTDPLLTPHRKGLAAASLYLTDRSYEDICRLREEILATTREQLRELVDFLRALAADSTVCVVGGQTALDSCGDRLTVIRSLQEKN